MSDLLEKLPVNCGQLRSLGVDLNNYCGLWSVDELRMAQMLWQVQSMNLLAHIEEHKNSAEFESRDYGVTGNNGSVAVIDISGMMTKKGSSLSGSGSTIRARQKIRAAANDQSVSGIVLRIDSPGGTVAGTEDLAADVIAARQKKPVVSFVEDLAASAAYWVASQSDSIVASSKTTQVGSIGTFLGLYDLSRMAENEGIKPVVVKAGKFKAAGFPGTGISDEQIEQWQGMVDSIQSHFTAAVASGRKVSVERASEFVTGLTYLAEDAKGMGLVDEIGSFESVVARLQSQPTKERKRMSQSTTYQDIVEACHGIQPQQNGDDAMFVADCQSKGLTAEQASKQWVLTLCDRTSSAREELAESKSENEKLTARVVELEAENAELQKSKSKGVPAVGTSEGGKDVDPQMAWKSAVDEKVAKGLSRPEAVKAVNRENPGLRQSMIAIRN